MSNTPQFDKAIAPILEALEPGEKECARCGVKFEILAADIEMYRRLQVPPPTLCWRCRLRRRLGHRISILPIFYKKPCAAPGHSEKIVSFYSEQNPVKVYDDKFYLSDDWDALEFGRKLDPDAPFFEQFRVLSADVPHQPLFKDPKGVDSEYVVSGVQPKNCYYCSIPYRSEDISYSYEPVYSKNCMDVNVVKKCESCYWCVNLEDSYNCSFAYDSSNCMDCTFIFDCKNCFNCFGCTNLRNKKYCLWNEQLTKEEYEKQIKAIDLGDRRVLRECQQRFADLSRQAVRKHVDNEKVERCLGNALRNCKNCHYAFDVFGGGENLRYLVAGDRITDLMDVYGSADSSLVYGSTGIAHGNEVKFSMMIRTGVNVEYSAECNNCDYIFGCIGLRSKKFCIMNVQYEQEEYWRQVDAIKTAMLARGEYGEFLPLTASILPYNDSNAMIEFPIDKSEAEAEDLYWQDAEAGDSPVDPAGSLAGEDIPANIKDVNDDILEKALICEKTGKPFRIIKSELEWYRHKNLPLPTVHPLERIKDRLLHRHPFRLSPSQCSKCGKDILTFYDQPTEFNIYCEECYKAAVV